MTIGCILPAARRVPTRGLT